MISSIIIIVGPEQAPQEEGRQEDRGSQEDRAWQAEPKGGFQEGPQSQEQILVIIVEAVFVEEVAIQQRVSGSVLRRPVTVAHVGDSSVEQAAPLASLAISIASPGILVPTYVG
jgi:hypothetical protein